MKVGEHDRRTLASLMRESINSTLTLYGANAESREEIRPRLDLGIRHSMPFLSDNITGVSICIPFLLLSESPPLCGAGVEDGSQKERSLWVYGGYTVDGHINRLWASSALNKKQWYDTFGAVYLHGDNRERRYSFTSNTEIEAYRQAKKGNGAVRKALRK